jgi:putative transposase
MPYIKIWIHLIWATKDKNPYLTETIRINVLQHITENAKVKGIHLDHIMDM